MAVAFSPVAVNKFFHTVLSCWVLGAVFVVRSSAWYLIRKREKEFALASMRVSFYLGLFAALVTAARRHFSLSGGSGATHETGCNGRTL